MNQLLLLTLCLTFSALSAQSGFERQLFNLPDLSFEKIDTPEGWAAAYELRIRQPIDPDNPDLGHFYQRVFLTHQSPDQPTVIVTEGYNRSRNRLYELTRLLDANQIMVEHRYTGESVPEQMDWQYLNLKQATADLHRSSLCRLP